MWDCGYDDYPNSGSCYDINNPYVKLCFPGSYKYEPEVCNGCHYLSMVAYELENISILNVKGADYRCVLWNMTKNDAINRLNNFQLDDKGSLRI